MEIKKSSILLTIIIIAVCFSALGIIVGYLEGVNEGIKATIYGNDKTNNSYTYDIFSPSNTTNRLKIHKYLYPSDGQIKYTDFFKKDCEMRDYCYYMRVTSKTTNMRSHTCYCRYDKNISWVDNFKKLQIKYYD